MGAHTIGRGLRKIDRTRVQCPLDEVVFPTVAVSWSVHESGVMPRKQPIIVVHEQSVLREALVTMLELEDYFVIPAQDAMEAVEHALACHAAVIVLDAPDDPQEATRWLADIYNYLGDAAPVVVTLGFPAEATSRNVVARLAKPYSPFALMALLGELINAPETGTQ